MKKKQCRKCLKYLDPSEFYDKKRSKVRADGTVHRWVGKYSQCKKCHYQNNKENAHKYDEYYREYRKANKDKIREKTRQHYIKNKRDWVNIISTVVELRCQKCGYDKNYAALDFHHVVPEAKDFGIQSIVNRGSPTEERWEMVKKELEKCIVLCANCHREEHSNFNPLCEDEKIAPKVTEVMRKD